MQIGENKGAESSSSSSRKYSAHVCEDDDGGHVQEASGISSTSTEEECQFSISRLPLHLILARLPVRKLCQLRSVCKAWNLMLGGVASAPGDPCIDEATEECSFIMARPKHNFKTWDVLAYSSEDGSSQQQSSSSFSPFPLPLPNPRHRELCFLLGSSARSRHRSRRFVRTMDISQLALATMGGLMCALVRGGPDAFSLIVFNCLTVSLRVLPPPCNPHHLFPASSKPPCYMSMASNSRDSGRHYIMLTCHLLGVYDSELPLHLEVYDSKHERWKLGCSVDFTVTAGLPLWDGDIFLIFHSTTMSVVACHVAHNVWSIVQAPRRTSSESHLLYAMLKYKRRLLVGQPLKCSIQDIHTCRGFGVWELQCSASSKIGTWVEVARTPHHLWLPLPYSDWTYNLFSGGSFFCIVFQGV